MGDVVCASCRVLMRATCVCHCDVSCNIRSRTNANRLVSCYSHISRVRPPSTVMLASAIAINAKK